MSSAAVGRWFDEEGEGVDKLLQTLLDELDLVEEEHEEIGDTEVVIQLTKAIHEGFISPKPNFVLPEDFQMFTRQGNRKVRTVLQRFLKKAIRVAEAEGLDTPTARLAAFQNTEVFSEGGSTYNDFFNYVEVPG